MGKGARVEDSPSLHNPDRVRRAHALRRQDAWANARDGAHILKLRSARLSTLLFHQIVPPLRRIAREAALPAQVLEREHDLASVVAAERGHEILEEFRAVP